MAAGALGRTMSGCANVGECQPSDAEGNVAAAFALILIADRSTSTEFGLGLRFHAGEARVVVGELLEVR